MMRTFKKSLPAGKQGNDTTRLGRDTLHRLKTRPETFRSNWRSKACFFRNRLSTKKACLPAGRAATRGLARTGEAHTLPHPSVANRLSKMQYSRSRNFGTGRKRA